MTRICIAIATLGRPDVVARTVDLLRRQRRRPDAVVIAATSPADVGRLTAEADGARFEVIYSEKGLCRQRNNALAHLRDRADVILFLDDDFVLADNYVGEVERLFDERPNVVGTTGTVLADGVCRLGLSFEDALAILAADRRDADERDQVAEALYGCNMAIRVAAAAGLRFDEALPLYGWLEDVDFTYRLGKFGTLLRTPALRGVHLGVKGGRTSGVRLGYSQIANPLYMLRKGSAPPKLAFRMMARNLAANLARGIAPEPYIDRRGRLRGNLLALRHLVTMRLDPRYVLELR